jgi:hypothetical protein
MVVGQHTVGLRYSPLPPEKVLSSRIDRDNDLRWKYLSESGRKDAQGFCRQLYVAIAHVIVKAMASCILLSMQQHNQITGISKKLIIDY